MSLSLGAEGEDILYSCAKFFIVFDLETSRASAVGGAFKKVLSLFAFSLIESESFIIEHYMNMSLGHA